MRRSLVLVILLLGCFCGVLRAAEVIPARPTQYFNDYAHFVQPQTADELNQKLAQFEHDTTNQIVVAIYPKMQSDSSIADYATRTFQKWGVGQKGKDNGVVLFVFVADRTMWIQTGYGLEGALPDALCKRIIEDEIKPHFKSNDPDGGLRAGVVAILGATAGEYKGTGASVPPGIPSIPTNHSSGALGWFCIIVFFLIILVLTLSSNRRGTSYNSGGYSSAGWQIGGAILNILLNVASSGGGGGSSSSGGGGGGFSAGGGSTGGGGAGGSW